MKKVVINKYIVADPEVSGGKLTFAGTRVMVWQVLDALAHGESHESVLGSWPSLSQEHIQAALALAASRAEGEHVIGLTPTDREVLSR